jgi:hypothetical protein
MEFTETYKYTGSHIGLRLLLNWVVKGLYRKIAYRHTWEDIIVINLINVMYVVKGLYRKMAYRHTWEDILVIKPCKCDVCGKGFTQKKWLRYMNFFKSRIFATRCTCSVSISCLIMDMVTFCYCHVKYSEKSLLKQLRTRIWGAVAAFI